ncbi:hypothetical protein [Thalassospira sp. TSL5-1]|uniref:hypothetical protein n=1 Tax=Thalassospira sp. TSL5-1 TaxID=1544451 RepID=UPI001160F55E|nr:hypothetical protein [Thalassospira sp. TSL5-1]
MQLTTRNTVNLASRVYELFLKFASNTGVLFDQRDKGWGVSRPTFSVVSGLKTHPLYIKEICLPGIGQGCQPTANDSAMQSQNGTSATALCRYITAVPQSRSDKSASHYRY